MSLKHNKKRNTYFLFEALIKEITNLSISNDITNRDNTIKLIKESFQYDTLLYKEVQLYKTLLESRGLSSVLSEKLLLEVKNQHKRINEKDLYREQTNLLVKINELNKNIFNNFVSNYKDMASIAQIFSSDIKPKSKIILEEYITSEMSKKKKVQLVEQKETKEITKLVLKTFIARYNKTYGSLNENQKTLLTKFILSDAEQSDFLLYLNEEVGRIKGQLNTFETVFPEYKQKLVEVHEKFEDLRNKKTASVKDLELILKTQELLETLKPTES